VRKKPGGKKSYQYWLLSLVSTPVNFRWTLPLTQFFLFHSPSKGREIALLGMNYVRLTYLKVAPAPKMTWSWKWPNWVRMTDTYNNTHWNCPSVNDSLCEWSPGNDMNTNSRKRVTSCGWNSLKLPTWEWPNLRLNSWRILSVTMELNSLKRDLTYLRMTPLTGPQSKQLLE
jgi:hypothetical protein